MTRSHPAAITATPSAFRCASRRWQWRLDINTNTNPATLALDSAEFFVKHVGHELKHFSIAVVEFDKGAPHWVAYHDSAFLRARTLIDFFTGWGDKKNVYVRHFYDPPGAKNPSTPKNTMRWFAFISARSSHIGKDREVSFDQWPDRKPRQEKGEDRLRRLAGVVLALARSRLPVLRQDCRAAMELMVNRSEAFLKDPSDSTMNNMDPAQVARALGISLMP